MKILIIRRNKLGDAITTLPLIQHLKKAFSQPQIDVICNEYNAPIFERSPVVTRVFALPPKYIFIKYGIFFHPIIRKLRKEAAYDVIKGASGSFSSYTAYIAVIIPALKKVGIKKNKISIWNYAWNIPIEKPQYRGLHQVARITNLASALNIPTQEPEEPTLKTIQIKHGILLCPSSTRLEQNWPYWEQLERMLSSHGHKIKWLAEKPKSSQCGILIAKNTTELLNILDASEIVICYEGGISHCAPALKTATICISSRNIASTWGPYSSFCTIVEGAPKSILPKNIANLITNYYQTGSLPNQSINMAQISIA